MRKVLVLALAASGILTMTGCLKDKGFEDQKYGIKITEIKTVAFPEATSSPLVYGINSQVTPQTVNGPQITLENGGTAAGDVKVTLTVLSNAALYDLDSTLVPLNVTEFSVNSLVVTIASGTKFSDALKVTIPNAALLDPTQSYGVGFQISSVDQGYKIASNMKVCVVAFNIKNQYDGVYSVTGAALRAGDPALTGPFGPVEREMATSGVSSIQWGGQVPWANGSGSALPGGYEPNVTINPANNLVTSVTSPNGAIYMTSPVYNTTVVGTTQRYDPATKTIYFEFSYGGGPTSRLFSFKAVYLRPR